ncbi:riboflavin synthase beta-chain [Paramagnetospirillum caucaseum]|uniref:6,7-dimethyl-8-ribityllumazine synthase n=1 Tax=Paramagnetospirillum caucaseum TaxID=1244869 RepID=M3AAI2_9PROT|nr:6,7-dimethyl-8-ribityllumazine synthase [Paramagnetospirillum caucaseum]EME69783.1 riboflavin synthase beta-chain [Paramagnetospirillum caucaseum]
MAKVLIIEARFYDHIADGLLAGARAEFDKAGVAHDLLVVPGIFELPAALKLVLTAAEQGNDKARYDGYVTLGCAIRGESDHYHHVGTECMRGIADLSMAYDLALGNGVLTVHNEAQALARSDPARKNLGGQAARACLRMMAVKRELGLSS